jgi:pimeloyl-ACP methyl ester carboxylesterase
MTLSSAVNAALSLVCACLIVSTVLAPVGEATAATSIAPAYADHAPRGPERARGVVIYSHGRSLTGEDSKSPPPAYLKDLAKSGWDVLRFNRPRREDTLLASSADLAGRAAELRSKGYKRVILTGQSFGAFLSIMAAAKTTAVDGVIATSPAAFGSYLDSFDTWRMNASQLFVALAQLHHARILLAFFHGDDYDPGGRAEEAGTVLARNDDFAVIIDQPPGLVGHLAAATSKFAKGYGSCLDKFAEGLGLEGDCDNSQIIRPTSGRPHQVAATPADAAARDDSVKTPPITRAGE